jgi:hypothetical protein
MFNRASAVVRDVTPDFPIMSICLQHRPRGFPDRGVWVLTNLGLDSVTRRPLRELIDIWYKDLTVFDLVPGAFAEPKRFVHFINEKVLNPTHMFAWETALLSSKGRYREYELRLVRECGTGDPYDDFYGICPKHGRGRRARAL